MENSTLQRANVEMHVDDNNWKDDIRFNCGVHARPDYRHFLGAQDLPFRWFGEIITEPGFKLRVRAFSKVGSCDEHYYLLSESGNFDEHLVKYCDQQLKWFTSKDNKLMVAYFSKLNSSRPSLFLRHLSAKKKEEVGKILDTCGKLLFDFF